MPAPTLRQIAVRCRVNVSTVSRALRSQGSIPPATQIRVRQAATAMGWAPNPLAAAYMAHLRSKIEPDPAAPKLLINEMRVGYRLVVLD